MEYVCLLLLLAIATTYSWYAGKRTASNSMQRQNDQFARDYFIGLNFLLNEQPDKAVDVFTRLVEVDSETIETHFALGNLFRRRGEVGRAIRIHQNLIARPQLTKEERLQALLALGQDYLRAGVLDRAERLFDEVVVDGTFNHEALEHLLDIYQQQKNWTKAIDTAQQLASNSNKPVSYLLAHYYCELATIALQESRPNDARAHLKQALKVDPNCARANLILGAMDRTLANFKSAIYYYQQVRLQDPDYFGEALAPLVSCYEQLDDEEGLVAFLQETLTMYPRISVVLTIAQRIEKKQGESAAADFITTQLRQRPSLRGLQYLINLQLGNAEATAKENLLILQDLTTSLLHSKPVYRCNSCGFRSKTLIWLCPSCKHWSSIKPIHGAEGD